MADPLSLLGAAVGVMSLIIQITEECVKGFKFYHEATNLPETYHHLRVRLQIEQQRFLNFGLEAGILYSDGVISSNLQINRSLLIAVLAEIKSLLENYAEINGKYEKFTPAEDVNWDDYKEPEMDLTTLLCLPSDNKTENGREHSESKKVESLKRVREFGKTIVQTGRNLRTIVVKPKRLVWAAVDKDSFESLISKIEDLNSFLITLLDSSQLRRLQDTMNTTYLEILQLRNDVLSLNTLVRALTPIAENQQKSLHVNVGTEDNPLFQAVTEETRTQQKRKSYLKQLVEFKIHMLDQLNSKTMISSDSNKFIGNSLPLDEFAFAEDVLECNTLPQRTSTTYRESNVWVEWKDNSAGNGLEEDEVERRISLLTHLLCFVKPDGFRAPPCFGYVKIVDGNHTTRFGIVFEKPLTDSIEPKIVTLRELLIGRQKPSLNRRISLCAILARCVHSFHAVNWLHKALRADNVVFFSSSEPPNLSLPCVSGFELSRPSIIDQMTEKPGFDPYKDIYRHPNAQSSQTDGNYRKSYDIYSLGILIIEIALWTRIEDIVGFENLQSAKPAALREIQPWLLGRLQTETAVLPPAPADNSPCLEQVASACGDAFRNVVERCLEADIVERPQYVGEHETAVALRLQRVTENDIVQKLEHINGAL